LFDAMGQKTFVIGEKPSDANLIKLSGNFLIAATIESLGEAIALIRKSGIDAHRYVEILTGTLFSAPVYKTYGAIIADEKYEPAGFKMALGFKDIRLAFAAAETLEVPMPIASLVRNHFLCGLAQGGGDSDWAALARIAARNSGRSLPAAQDRLLEPLQKLCAGPFAAGARLPSGRGAPGAPGFCDGSKASPRRAFVCF
jgi:3-hydroxyisobutyrate dehydrogenase-like beta-hydroxyacid dehydrogenase